MCTWIDACATTDIDEEDLISWEYEGQKIAIYNTEEGWSEWRCAVCNPRHAAHVLHTPTGERC